jgi:hypothetical protein
MWAPIFSGQIWDTPPLTAVLLNWFNIFVLALQKTFGGENEVFEGTCISGRDRIRLLNPWWM